MNKAYNVTELAPTDTDSTTWVLFVIIFDTHV